MEAAEMNIETRNLEYEIDGKIYEAVIAASGSNARPAVLVAHAWAGRSEFEAAPRSWQCGARLYKSESE